MNHIPTIVGFATVAFGLAACVTEVLCWIQIRRGDR